eukprot:3481326-Rhodomonas_salina.2
MRLPGSHLSWQSWPSNARTARAAGVSLLPIPLSAAMHLGPARTAAQPNSARSRLPLLAGLPRLVSPQWVLPAARRVVLAERARHPAVPNSDAARKPRETLASLHVHAPQVRVAVGSVHASHDAGCVGDARRASARAATRLTLLGNLLLRPSGPRFGILCTLGSSRFLPYAITSAAHVARVQDPRALVD